MLRITVMSGPQDGFSALLPGRELTIGRGSGADFCLPHDPEIPPTLARVYRSDGDLRLLIDGKDQAIRPGELFQVGRTWLTVTEE